MLGAYAFWNLVIKGGDEAVKIFDNLIHNSSLVGTVSLWLGIIALIIACIQFRDAHKQAKLMESQSNALGFVTQSLTTRYIGPFPEYLPQVADLIETAKVELRIITGNPVPAYFSAPNVFMNYSHAIERKVRSGVDVTMTCMDQSQRLKRLKLQFPTSQEAWEAWLPVHRGEVETFAKYRF